MADQLPCRWEQEACTPAELPARVALPRVVRFIAAVRGGTPAPSCLGAAADMSQPFIAYSQRRRTKGYARHLVPNERTGGFVSDDLLIEIPKDYAGFFEILSKDPKKVPVHHASIRAIVETGCERFLVQTVLGGFHTSQRSTNTVVGGEVLNEEVTILDKHLIYPGEVLHPVRTVTKRWRLRGRTRQLHTEYMLCRDLNGKELVVPMAHPGTFCALRGTRTRSKHYVWSASELLSDIRLPVTVRLVFGWPPSLPEGREFSGILQILGKRRPSTLVVYNLHEKTAVVGELPMDMRIFLQPASNQREIMETGVYRTATKRCDRAVFCYVTNLKALDLEYHPLTSGAECRPGIAHGMLASAFDMSAFNIRNIFPPVTEKEFSNSSWPITFRDPLDGGSLYEDSGDSSNDGAPGDGWATRLKREKSMSGLDRIDRTQCTDDETTSSDMESNLSDARRSRVEEADSREAQC